MKIKASLKYFVSDCVQKAFSDSNLSQKFSNLIYLTILVTLRLLALFQPKVRAIKLQNSAKSSLS